MRMRGGGEPPRSFFRPNMGEPAVKSQGACRDKLYDLIRPGMIRREWTPGIDL